MDIDWQAEVNETTESPADVLGFFLADAEHIDHLVVVAFFNKDAKREDLRDTVVKMSNAGNSYVRLGLLHDALNMEQAVTKPHPVEDT